MPPDVAVLRRATRTTLALGLLVFACLGVLFGVVLHPVVPRSCTTGLYPGTYADALLPAHLAAFALLAGSVAWLATLRDGRRRPPRRAWLALAGLFVLAGAFVLAPELGLYFVVLGPLPAFVLLIRFVLGLVAIARADVGAVERWRRYARAGEAALWTALAVVLPIFFGAAWVNGAGLFCF